MIRITKYLIFAGLISLSQLSYSAPTDTTLNDKQFFGGFGSSLYGYTPKINSYFSFYYIYGYEYNVTEEFKYGYSIDAIKLNWTRFVNDSSFFKGTFDKVRCFSFSTDFQFFTRYIISRDNYPTKPYDKYIEIGLGYNLPFYYSLTKINGNIHTIEQYPNRYTDFYLYSEYYFWNPLKLPLGIKLEYHPFNILKNKNYPQLSIIQLNLDILLHDNDHKKKK